MSDPFGSQYAVPTSAPVPAPTPSLTPAPTPTPTPTPTLSPSLAPVPRRHLHQHRYQHSHLRQLLRFLRSPRALSGAYGSEELNPFGAQYVPDNCTPTSPADTLPLAFLARILTSSLRALHHRPVAIRLRHLPCLTRVSRLLSQARPHPTRVFRPVVWVTLKL